MERLRTLSRFWNWLPAFRAIGESSHLPSAAEALHLSPSALSRSLQQLERSLGRQLFRREHRRLSLTPEGEQLLDALREAMRIVHEATLRIRSDTVRGTLTVGSAGVATTAWVFPAILDLRQQHPELAPELRTDLRDAPARLLSGRLDIAFSSERIRHPLLRSVELGVMHAGVHCGPHHPLFEQSEVALDQLVGAEFIGPPASERGVVEDGWPEDLERRVVLQVDRMSLGCEACASMPLLAVLPDLVAEREGRGRLRRLPVEVIPPTPVFATLRPPIGHTTAAERMLEAVRQRIAGD